MKNNLLKLLCSVIFMTTHFMQAIDLQIRDQSFQAIVLAAGEGSRFKTGITKLVTPICGQPMVLYPIKLLEKMKVPITAVVGFQKDLVTDAIKKGSVQQIAFSEQQKQLGTGHALLASKDTWQADTLLVMNGDMPLITPESIEALCAEHFKTNAAISVVTSYNVDPANTFGRIVRQGDKIKIVEKKHFTYNIKEYPQVNVGVYLINRAFASIFINFIEQNNKTNEFYITDLVEIASNNNLIVNTVELPFDQFYGVNTFEELNHAEQIIHHNILRTWMAQGVRFIAPHTTVIDHNVRIGRGSVIHAGVHVLNGSTIGEFCTVKAGTILDNVVIENNVSVGAHCVLDNITIAKDAIVDPLMRSIHSPVKNVPEAPKHIEK